MSPEPSPVPSPVPSRPRRVALATFAGVPPDFAGDQPLVAALERLGATAARVPWDAEGTDWTAFDKVLIRSTWNYTKHRERFVSWVDSLGDRVHNDAATVRWNSDKRYLAELAAAGLPVVPTTFVAPGQELPPITADTVVKPTVSAGARDTGRFSQPTEHLAHRLIRTIQATGRQAMVQPYQARIDTLGETAVVCVDGEPSHALRKKPILRPDQVAPVRADGLGAAEAMYDPGLMTLTTAGPEQLALATQALAYVTERIGAMPLYGRVDMVEDDHGQQSIMELELIEPNLYFDHAPGSADRLAAAVLAAIG